MPMAWVTGGFVGQHEGAYTVHSEFSSKRATRCNAGNKSAATQIAAHRLPARDGSAAAATYGPFQRANAQSCAAKRASSVQRLHAVAPEAQTLSSDSSDSDAPESFADGGASAGKEHRSATAAHAADHPGGAAAAHTQPDGLWPQAQAGSDAASDEVSPAEGQRRLKRAADLLSMVHIMAPSDPATFNRALTIWCEMEQ